MITLFNDNWQFAELSIDGNSMYKDGKPVLFTPDDFFENAQTLLYKPVSVPHDWQIWHVQDLYKNSVGCYKKTFTLKSEEIDNCHIAIRFEGVYMNSAIWINGKKAGEWKYGYSTFEFDISDFVTSGENEITVIAVYENCNTRWYSGAGIFRDVWLTKTGRVWLSEDGNYFRAKKRENCKTWSCKGNLEVCGNAEEYFVRCRLLNKEGSVFFESKNEKLSEICGEDWEYLQKNVSAVRGWKVWKGEINFEVENPHLWDVDDPYFYILETEVLDKDEKVADSKTEHFGFKTAVFDKDKGFFLNGRHLKINGACHHHDHGAFGAAFDKNALRRQFLKLKEMGVNSVRCSHNPPPKGWMDLCDELGIMVDDEAFDMWEKPKTPFDYGNYFNDWCERDTVNWVRRDRNHPSLIMWSIGNEIYDTHMGNGYEITKKLYSYVRKNDFDCVTPITIASNYMMTDGAQRCAQEIDTVGYNYLERLYNEHHSKYPEWKIYGSETASTVQSRGIYHFPDSLKLVTFSDGQCSTLGNCTTSWGCESTQKVITNDRDCPFSAGQYIWTGWDYIGEPTPYHSKNSYFGQIDTAGFPKDTFFLYKSEWAGKKAKPFVHLLPYWDWNEGQIIDVKAYTNAESVELFFNEKSLGRQNIDHEHGLRPFGQWQLEYHKGEIKAVAYDVNGNVIAQEVKRSFGDPAKIVMTPETFEENGKCSTRLGNLFFIDLMTVDAAGTPVENARNYITFNVTGDAELVGMDNGDSTDYEEYKSDNGNSHSRKLFANRLLAIVRAKNNHSSFVITAASEGLDNVSLKYDGEKWVEAAPYWSIHPVYDFIPTRKIEIIAGGSPKMDTSNRQITVTAKVLPVNASIKEINWNPVLKECVSSDYIHVESKTGEGTGSETAIIKAVSDGDCILRCVAKNGSELDEVISDLNFSVKGLGNPKLNPFKLIEGCRFTLCDESKKRPSVSLESGITNRGCGATWVGFEKVDFGADGADRIHIPIFSFETQLPVEVWDGVPGKDCLGKFTYSHESVYNTFNENVFTLNRRLFGVHTISIVMPHDFELKGFYFDKTPKAFAKLRALDADVVIGDTFTKTQTAIEGIGNNVNLDFANMDFSEKGATKLIICGKSNNENNTINIKFFGENSTETQVIEFEHTSDYEEKTFELKKVCGLNKVSFVFLPGCNFDFKYFRFE